MGILEYKKIKIVTRVELLTLINKYMKIKDPIDLIEKLLKKEKLKILKNGIYMVIPFASVDGKWTLSELEINDYLLKGVPYYIGLYNAFHLHHFTEQVPNKLFVFNTKYSVDRKILNYKFKLFKIKKNKFSGITTEFKYPYSDKERTIIDALDYADYMGGLGNVVDAVKATGFNKGRLVDYVIRYRSIKVMKLVGWLTNSAKTYRMLKGEKALEYYTTIKNTNKRVLDKKWKLRLI